jgi:nitroreductase
VTTLSAELSPLLAGRRSPRAFDPAHELADTELDLLLEALRWAPSASNTQPWRVAVARRGTPEHAVLVGLLKPGNAGWAPQASALLLVAAQERTEDGPRPWAAYDTGGAVGHLTVQAQALGLAVHQMGGFDAVAAASRLQLPEGVRPLVVVAVGRALDPADAPADLREREQAPRTRRPVADLLLEVPTA